MHLLTDHEGLDITLQIHVDTNDYLPKFMSELKNQRKTLQMKGFRKGEAPIQLLRKLIGTEKLAKVLDETLNEAISNYLNEHKTSYIGSPINISINPSIDPSVDQGYVFEILLAEQGKILQMPQYDQTTFTRYHVEVSDEDVDDHIKNLRLRYAKEPKEIADTDQLELDDILSVTLEEVDEHGTPKAGGIYSNAGRFTISQIVDANWSDKFLQMHIGDTTVVSLFDLFKASRKGVAYSLLNITDADVATLPEQYKLTIDRAIRYEQPELDEDFFQQIYPNQSVTTEADFFSRVREDLEFHWTDRAEAACQNTIVDTLVKDTTYAIPQKYLYELWRRNEKNEIIHTEPAYSSIYENAIRQYQWQLLVTTLLATEDYEPSQQELEQEALIVMQEQLRQMGYNSFSAQWVNYAKNALKDPKQLHQIKARLASRKAIDKLLQDVSIQNVSISVEEFEKIDKTA